MRQPISLNTDVPFFENQLQDRFLPQKINSLFSVNKYVPLIEEEKKNEERKKEESQAGIRHSRTIQKWLMSEAAYLKRIFPESFLIDKPKEIVSGDFFWLREVENKIVIVIGDSTGHGVSAAMLSTIGICYLNQIVLEKKITDPSFILKNLSLQIKKTFSHINPANSIHALGMDLAICCIDFVSKTVSFEGALRPAYIISNKELIVLKGSRNMITGDFIQGYSTKLYNYKKGDMLYLFSDGFADQFGGKYNKKLLIKRFKNILLDISECSLIKQMNILEKFFNGWKSDMEQTDDIIMTGIKL